MALRLPRDSNEGISVFIPKSAVQPGQDDHRAHSLDLRPLTLGDASHAAIMLLINRVPEAYAKAIAHPSLRGWWGLLTNMAELECAVAGVVYGDEADLTTALLDIAEAFSSGVGVLPLGLGGPSRPGLC